MPTTMESVQFEHRERNLKMVIQKIPKICNPNDVLIKVLFSGVCEMDVHIVNCDDPCNTEEPFIMGHEICGVVTDIGEEVTTVSKRDRVVVDPYSDCGVCTCCRIGKKHLCREGCTKGTIGVFQNGGWAEFITVNQKQVFVIPDGVSLEQAALTEPLSYVSHGWSKISHISVTKKVFVMGAGLTGLLWIIMLHYHGYKNVIVSEPNLARHEFIQQLDIRYEIVSPKIATQRHHDDSKFSFDLILVCTGSAKAIEEAFTFLNPEGLLCLTRTPHRTSKINISPWTLQKQQANIIGINIASFCFPKTLDILECLSDRYISFQSLGVKTYPLSEFKQAVDHVKKGSVLKAMFRLPDDCHCRYAGALGDKKSVEIAEYLLQQ